MRREEWEKESSRSELDRLDDDASLLSVSDVEGPLFDDSPPLVLDVVRKERLLEVGFAVVGSSLPFCSFIFAVSAVLLPGRALLKGFLSPSCLHISAAPSPCS